MNASTVNHSRIAQNVYFALRTRLQGSGYEVLGPNVGVVTRGNAVRYPDALISGGGTRGTRADRHRRDRRLRGRQPELVPA